MNDDPKHAAYSEAQPICKCPPQCQCEHHAPKQAEAEQVDPPVTYIGTPQDMEEMLPAEIALGLKCNRLEAALTEARKQQEDDMDALFRALGKNAANQPDRTWGNVFALVTRQHNERATLQSELSAARTRIEELEARGEEGK